VTTRPIAGLQCQQSLYSLQRFVLLQQNKVLKQSSAIEVRLLFMDVVSISVALAAHDMFSQIEVNPYKAACCNMQPLRVIAGVVG